MADTKITDLTEDTTPLATDLLVTVDDPAGSPVNKKATIANVVSAIVSAWARAGTKPSYASSEITNISAAGQALIDDADAAVQRATLGAVATGDSRLSDARTPIAHTHPESDVVNLVSDLSGKVGTGDSRLSNARPASDVSAWAKAGAKPSYTYSEVGAPSTSDSRLSDARPASDVYAWAKAASKPSYTAAEVGTKKVATGQSGTTVNVATVIAHGLGAAPTFILAFNNAGTQVILAVDAQNSTNFTVHAFASSTMINWIAVT